ncbi:MAG TPA: hypothetical protein VHG88_09880 [Burkholderiales bacterium]|nr:hypothetical protein [Burkholderiales bacterium]
MTSSRAAWRGLATNLMPRPAAVVACLEHDNREYIEGRTGKPWSPP